MDALTISAVAAVGVLTGLAVLALLFRKGSKSSAVEIESDIESLMRQALRQAQPNTFDLGEQRKTSEVFPRPNNRGDESLPQPGISDLADVVLEPAVSQPENSLLPQNVVREVKPPEMMVTEFPTTGSEVPAEKSEIALANVPESDSLDYVPTSDDGLPDVQSEVPAIAADTGPNVNEAEEVESALEANGMTTIAPTANQDGAMPAKSSPAVHRDRRGRRRTAGPKRQEPGLRASADRLAYPPAELRLRLLLHPLQETVQLALIFGRPEGFPEHTSVTLDGTVALQSFDSKRYDDVDIPWLASTLDGELRFESPEGFSWLRSARRIHIFRADPSEAGLVSASSAVRDAEHVIICKIEDEPAISTVVESAGSPTLESLIRWQGIPSGWCVLSGYKPVRAIGTIEDAALRPLDPGFDIEIRLTGGLPLRSGIFAEGHPPTIDLPALPEGVSVTIDGLAARPGISGAWEADGWDKPGRHLIDVVPGPSLGYEIASDPASSGWQFWDAHSGRFAESAPWSQAQICGAALKGPRGEAVIAQEARGTLIALGLCDGFVVLRRRPDTDASIGLAAIPPAFLIVSSGPRRRQGEVIWLGLDDGSPLQRATRSLSQWANAVRSAASRRLRFRSGGVVQGKNAWLKAVKRARNLKRVHIHE